MHAVRRGKGPPSCFSTGSPARMQCGRPSWSVSGTAYETVAFDLPGFGASEKIEGTFSLADLAAAVDDALGSQGLVDAVVVGHSMGGMVAQHLYARSPERVAGLVLCGTTSSAGSGHTSRPRSQLKDSMNTQGSAAWAAAMGPGLFGARYQADERSQIEEFSQRSAACDESVLSAALDAITHFDLTDQLARIAVPCAVVVGDADPFLEDCRFLAQSISGASLSVLGGRGSHGTDGIAR